MESVITFGNRVFVSFFHITKKVLLVCQCFSLQSEFSQNASHGLDCCILCCILFVFVLALLCFCVAIEFLANKDLYI